MSSSRMINRRTFTISLLCFMLMVMPAVAQQSAGKEHFTDVVLINQHGQEMNFYSDVIKGNVVVISTFFATCASACPVINKQLAELQERLGDRLGNEIVFVSITVDPITDTPARLKGYAEKFNAGPGWIFLTGLKENVATVLNKLGQYVDQKEAHANILLIGNEPTGLWKKTFGLAAPDELYKVVESVLNDG